MRAVVSVCHLGRPPYTMLRLVVLSALVVCALGQGGYHGDPRTAAILAEDRYLGGDGRFGAQYQQEDGVNFKEESSADGTRRGTYSYVDPTGQRHTVSYTAGKHGFMAVGDGIPQPLPTTLPVAPQPNYTPQPQYNPPPQNNYRPPPQQYQQPQYQPPQQYQPQQYQQQQQQQYQPPQQYRPNDYQSTTPAPHRFYPPGQLSLNRSPDGFSFSFKQS